VFKIQRHSGPGSSPADFVAHNEMGSKVFLMKNEHDPGGSSAGFLIREGAENPETR
jgi:hypothetical protein